MISIDIIKAQDSNLLGNYQFYKSIIYIGSSHISDIYCPNSELNDIHFFIEVVDNKLILHLNKETDHVLVNSKRTIQFKNISKGSIIEAAGIKFKVIDFSEEEIVTKRDKLNSIVSTLKQDNPELLEIVSMLSEK